MVPAGNRNRRARWRLAAAALTVLAMLGVATAASWRAVGAATGEEGSFFLIPIPDIDRPTAHPTVDVDAAGGVHVAFTPDTNTEEDPTRPAYYAYCPSGCTSSSAFTVVPLGQHVDYANLALDDAGRPRMILRSTRPADQKLVYEYWTCDGDCTSSESWTSVAVAEAFARSDPTGEPFSRFFALDAAGRPRFVYFDAGGDAEDPHWGAFLAGCNGDCASVANWGEIPLVQDAFASDFTLALGPSGQSLLLYTSYDSDAVEWFVMYTECDGDCDSPMAWRALRLLDRVSASVTAPVEFALRADSAGRPRVVYYSGTGQGGTLPPGILYYLSCSAADCSEAQSWQVLDLVLPELHGEGGVALALAAQDRPRIAYHASLTAGDGLYYATCDADCQTSAEGWVYGTVEPSAKVNQELPIPPWPGCDFPQCNPPVPACSYSFWETGMRPSLALDPGGNPRIAYDADHQQGGGCGTFTDTRLTRFALFDQPGAPTTTTTTLPQSGTCGDPVALIVGASGADARAAAVTASDALFILSAAVGTVACDPCVCDVDGQGTVAASDALLALKKAVGEPVDLSCPPCP